MDDLLKPVSTVSIRKKPELHPPRSDAPAYDWDGASKVADPEDALNILKNGPGADDLFMILGYLRDTSSKKDGFNIHVPEPRTTQIVHVLVNDIIPSYWSTFNEEFPKSSSSRRSDSVKASLIESLRSLPGIGSIIARLKLLIPEARKDKTRQVAVDETLDALQEVLGKYTLTDDVRTGAVYYAQDQTKRTLFWKEVVNLRASGRIIAIAAEAEDSIKDSRSPLSTRWIASGPQYAAWLGRQVGDALLFLTTGLGPGEAKNAEKMLAQCTGRSLNMGYPNDVIREFLKSLQVRKVQESNEMGLLMQSLRVHEQHQFVDAVLSVLSENKFDEPSFEDVAGAAGLLAALIRTNESIHDHLIQRLTQDGPRAYDESIFSLRVMLVVISSTEDEMQQVMEKSMKRFGDKLYIKHNPILAQEALAQVLLISAGYVHRKQPMFLFTVARSSIHNAGISNRLAATSSHVRLLGMAVGTAISQLVDQTGAKLNFDTEDMNTDEAKSYQQLISIEDKIGDSAEVSAFLGRKWSEVTTVSTSSDLMMKHSPQDAEKNGNGRIVAEISEASKIQIVDDSDVDEDDDLIPYAKPDSDPEDDDEDPTLVNRNRPSAPVYIRDLITSLQDSENHERHVLALRTAPTLIRRKMNFGKEVSDHVVELANLFAGLGDHFELEDFPQLRLQCLVAVLVAQPRDMGRWFARAFFEGDYSISQRGAVLSAIGLGARELAGMENGDELTGPAKEMSQAFPSKQLPEKFHKLYGGDDDPVLRESKKLERGMIEPLALDAADKLSGPSALKVRTFSSRMDVEKKRKKPVSNGLGKIVADSVFFPLTGRFQMTLQAYGGKSMQSSPHLLPLYLRTLTLVLHAAGPSSPALPSMTSEFFDLLLGLRGHAMQDDNVLEALLFALLTTLDLNAGEDAATDGGQRLCTEMGSEMLEMQGWVEAVFEKANENSTIGLSRASSGVKGKGRGEERIGMLAAGVLTRIGEIVRKFQRILLGSMVAL